MAKEQMITQAPRYRELATSPESIGAPAFRVGLRLPEMRAMADNSGRTGRDFVGLKDDMRDKVRTQTGYRTMDLEEAHLYFWHGERPVEFGEPKRSGEQEVQKD